MNRFFALVFSAIWCGNLTATATAQTIIPDGQCAVVVASRPSLDAAKSYIREAGIESLARVYESSNGWLAITIGNIANTGSTETVNRLKNSRKIPQDAFCSTGAKYQQEVRWQAKSPSIPSQVNYGLWEEFDARPLTRTERRFLQAALAGEGYYNGLLDGAWGNRSQAALDRYAAVEFNGVKPANAHAAHLTMLTMDRWLSEGWDYRQLDNLGISVMLPFDHMRLENGNNSMETWTHRTKPLTIVLSDIYGYALSGVHEAATSSYSGPIPHYKVRNNRLWVTAAENASGRVYVRSDLISGTWSTVVVFADREAEADVDLISSSFIVGRPPAIVPQEGGQLLRHAVALGTSLSTTPKASGFKENRKNEAPEAYSPDQAQEASSSGTAFYVSTDGVALTNAHVVDGCRALTIDGKQAEIVAVSSAFDLAAIRHSESVVTPALPFSSESPRLNADITVAGFPLQGFLSGLNVTRGSISAMKGLMGDEATIQITAPVQSGNSGGPAIDRRGAVVGVVVSKLNVEKVAEVTGDMAQNVNFAVRGSLAQVFMESNGIDFHEVAQIAPLDPEVSAELLKMTTKLVECY